MGNKYIYLIGQKKDYAKDANSFLYGLQTYNVVAWMPIRLSMRYLKSTSLKDKINKMCTLKKWRIEYET